MKASWRDTIGFLLIAVVILVFTFPDIDAAFAPGIDPSLAWAYNYIFATDVNLGRDIVFPHGPLGFLMYPLAIGNNLDIAFWALCFIRITFFYLLLRLGSLISPAQWLAHTLIVIALALLLPFGMVLPGIVAAALLVFHFLPAEAGRPHKWLFLLLAVFFTALGLHIRAAYGIISVSLLFSYFVLYIYLRRDFKTPLFCGTLLVISLVLFRYFIYGDLGGFFNYYYGLYQLSRSSAATALYPDNNWWLLGGAGLLFLLFPVITRRRNAWLVYGLLLLPLFATWKHAMTREDFYHFRGLFMFLLLLFGLVVLVSDKLKKRSFIIAGLVLLLVYRNLPLSINYYEKQEAYIGINRFADLLTQREELKRESLAKSMRNVEAYRLPGELQTMIGQSTVDVYPWDFSFMPANGFNWKPRVIPQNYASYSPWLDEQNAAYFTSAKAPDYIIWELIENRWGGKISGLDDRYAFNDEPKTMLALLDNYTRVATTDKILLFKKTTDDHLGGSKITAEQEAAWNEWVTVPDAGNGIVRAKIEMQGTLWRFIKNQLYKDEQYDIEYRLDNGQEVKFRFVPEIAVNGVWVNPLIMHPENNLVEPVVKAIRFTCSNYKAVKGKVKIAWELTSVNASTQGGNIPTANKYAGAFALFGKDSIDAEKPKVSFFYDYEKEVAESSADVNAHSGSKSVLLEPEHYAPGLDYAADSLVTDSSATVIIEANAWMKTEKDAEINLVITVENANGASFWNAVNSSFFISDTGRWQPVFIKRTVSLKKGDRIKIFAWNVGKSNARIDDLDVKIFATPGN